MTKKKIFFIVGILFLVVVFVGGTSIHCAPLSRCPWEKKISSSAKKKVTLTLLGSWDDADAWKQVISDFNVYEGTKRGLDITVKYEQIDKYNYEEILFDRQVNKKGPNMFMMYNTWLPKYQQRIISAPESMMTVAEFEKTFAKVTADDLIAEEKIYSLPLYVDTLALYYNKTMLYNAGFIRPPETWSEFTDYIEKLTIMGEGNKIEVMGAVIGGAEYVNRSQDILMLLVMQNNIKSTTTSNLVSFRSPEGQRAVKFYTDFADPTKRYYTWNYDDRMYSIDAFTQSKAAMSINYSYELENIDSKTGGNLDYGVALVPQQYPNNKINYASYWAPVVAKDAPCEKEDGVNESCALLSWEFIKFASEADNVRSYLDATRRPAANLVVAKEQSEKSGDPIAPFASQVLTAYSWDNPNNEKTDELLVNMIDSIITTDKSRKKDFAKAMGEVANDVKELN